MRQKLRIENPALMDEWDYDANAALNPDDFTGGSNEKVGWKCRLGHTWTAQINKRFTFGRGCPYCSGNKVWPGFNDLRTTSPHVADSWDYERNGDLCPEQFSAGADVKIWWRCDKCGHSWNAVIYSRKNSGCPACAKNIMVSGVNDLQTMNPALAAEWKPVRNGDLQPDSIAANDNRKMWWLCDKGHSWQATVASRNASKGCPYCTNRKLLVGFNDLLTVSPKLSTEWCYEKNGVLRPEDMITGSHEVVWWRCNSGHSWQASVVNRQLGSGCPYDAGKRILEGFNDLKTKYPALCEEWDYAKNKSAHPEKTACHTHEVFWWRCREKGHSYRASAANRTRGTGCPYCANKRPVVGKTDFATVHPELISDWDFEKNEHIRPEQIVAGSHRKIWWRCKEGHRWKTAACNRSLGSQCPRCMSLKDKHIVIEGETDLATIYPTIAKDWDYARNEGLRPQDVLPHSTRYVWWTCEHGHHWRTKIQARVKGSQCPRCHGKTPMMSRLI